MEELIRISHQSLEVIPSINKFTLHAMYEDTDGAENAEAYIEFLEREAPGIFVGILANNSVSQNCGHYKCDHYDEYWYTILISKTIWEQYKEQVEAADLKWKHEHGCKLSKVN